MAEGGHIALILGALGDFLLTLPLLCRLRGAGPVAILSRGPYRALLPPCLADAPFVDTDGLVGALLFADGVDLPAGLARRLPGAVVHAFLRGDHRLEANLLRHGARRLVWHHPRPAAPPHIALRFFAEAGEAPSADLLETPVMPRADAHGDALWLHPGSGSPAKSLTPADLVRFALRAPECGARRIVVSFGDADLGLVDPVLRALSEAGVTFTELVCPGLPELRRRLADDAAAFIGPDTGVTHLAAALGIPTTAVFRATDPAVWRPLGRVQVMDQRRAGGAAGV